MPDRGQVASCAIHHDRHATRSPEIEFDTDSVIKAVGLPVQRKQPGVATTGKFLRTQDNVILGAVMHRAGDVAMCEQHGLIGESAAGIAHQRVFAAAGGPDQIDQSATLRIC